MIKNLLAHGDYNVIQTHWGRGASSIYQQSALNTRVVGLEIAYLANTLIVSECNSFKYCYDFVTVKSFIFSPISASIRMTST